MNDVTGVLLANLGTPDEPTPAAVRRFLAEFLSDPRVVDLPRLLWLPILYGVILLVRPRRSARAYRDIWTPTGSPLLVNTLALARALERRLDERLPGPVTVAAVVPPPEHLRGIRDSKQLTARARESLAPLIKEIALAWSVGFAGATIPGGRLRKGRVASRSRRRGERIDRIAPLRVS